jgi:glucose/arabinose dehydrogenase
MTMKTTILLAAALLSATSLSAQTGTVSTGQAAFADWNQQQPGARRKITLADLPDPRPDEAVNNTPHVIAKPADAWPIAPPGFKVTLYAGGDNAPMQRADNVEHMAVAKGTFTEPRLIRTAPNGDLFLADSGAGKIIVMRGVTAEGKAATFETFVSGLDHPFGIAFYPAVNPRYVYIGNATSVVRFPYKAGDLHASAPAEVVVPSIPGYAQLQGGGHWTRDVVFSKDGSKMLVSVGSGSNIANPDTDKDRTGGGRDPKEFHRADVLEFTPDGKFLEVYAYGLRNCVGEAINPITGSLWCSTNERDNLGNHLVPDYVTSVPEGSFFGWPWYYMGGHQDPRLPQPCADGTGPNPQAPAESPDPATCKHVDLSAKVRTPDVIVQPHMASLEMTFYPNMVNLGGGASDPGWFPKSYSGDAFAAEHGSWNRANRAGYEVIRIPMKNGKSLDGSYEDFLTGFVTKDGQVWGRPVGVTIGKDGSMFVTDDGSRSVWHVTYVGK